MTTTHSTEPNWQEKPATYTKVRAIRELTAGCPCDTCDQRVNCADTGRECFRFKDWTRSGK